ncbi:AraC family transcriptional regulator [Paenibacillus pabuli]|uniref:AraC family transcriptional regulator n=1 Tax=Paenibacillus pabuli TaxID=1472 RepID=UPI001FFFD8F8|nr:AraC family transcriptional regulator [Paenibacillus pabuli]UPK41511.1 AraC family transcriptional regulator [Paenibacillus pabuli]
MMNLEVFSDFSERLDYNFPDMPLYIRKGNLHQFNDYAAAAHWHADMEFIVLLEGSMKFSVNGHVIHLDNGSGIFVNSHRLHYGFSPDNTDCSFIVVVIHPSLLGEESSFIRTYWSEKSGPHMDDFVVLADQIDWQRNLMASLQNIYEEAHCAPSPNPIRLASQALSICATIGDHLQLNSEQSADAPVLIHVQKMTHYIHQNYDEKLTLEDIASAGAVCRSRCCTLFNKYVGQTPNSYLTRYRIQKSCEMLKETKRSISEIALACGFQSASYFSSIFRKQMGLIPQSYRKQKS